MLQYENHGYSETDRHPGGRMVPGADCFGMHARIRSSPVGSGAGKGGRTSRWPVVSPK